MDNIKQPPATPSRHIYESVLEIMTNLKKHYSNTGEFKTIMMNLGNVAKEINNIRIKEITGENEQAKQ